MFYLGTLTKELSCKNCLLPIVVNVFFKKPLRDTEILVKEEYVEEPCFEVALANVKSEVYFEPEIDDDQFEYASEENWKDNFAAHPSKRTCKTCGEEFASVHKLRQHRKSRICKDDPPPTSPEIRTASRKRKDKEKAVHKCDHCPLLFYGPAGVTLHRQRVFMKGDKGCNLCDIEFETPDEARKHITESHPNKFKIVHECRQCPEVRTFKCPSDLKSHVNQVHLKVKEFRCHICGKDFFQSYRLNDHILTHTDPLPFGCAHCPKKCKSKVNVLTHLLSKHGFNIGLQCPHCQKAFVTRNAMEIHLKRHTKQLDYSCDKCDKRFVTASNLKMHQEKMHVDKTARKYFICETCGKKLTSKHSYQNHVKTHLGDEHMPFRCQYCGKGYTGKYALDIHVRGHTGETPFVCSMCGKGFRDKNGYDTHMRNHRGEKPFVCSVCSKGFADHSGLRKHLKNHEKEMGVKLTKTMRDIYWEGGDNEDSL